MIEVKNIQDLYSIDTTKHTIAQVKSTGDFYHYEEEWKKLGKDFQKGKVNSNIAMSQYEIGKQVFGQLSPVDKNKVKEVLTTYINNNKQIAYTLLSWEIHYFTVFIPNFSSDETLEDIVIDCLSMVGEIKNIAISEQGDVEIWVTQYNGETDCLHFFPYEDFIVPYGG